MKLTEFLNPSNVEKIYDNLKEHTFSLFAAEMEHLGTQQELKSWYAQGIAEGVIQGKNETEREGNARIMRPDLYDSVDASYSRLAQVRMESEKAKLEERKLSRICQVAEICLQLQSATVSGLAELMIPGFSQPQAGADSWVTPEEEKTAHTATS